MARALQAYIAALKAEAEAVNNRSKRIDDWDHSGSREVVKPLTVQIEEMMSSLPPRLRDRSWSMEELVLHLRGRYRERPNASAVGVALRALGWVRIRDWTIAGAGRRLWMRQIPR